MYAITVVLLITMQLMFINLIVHRICDYEYKAVRCILVNVISVVVLSDAIIIDKGLWCLIAANVLVFVIFAFAMSAKSSVGTADTKDSYIEYNKADFLYLVKLYTISVVTAIVVMLLITAGSNEMLWYYDKKPLIGMCLYTMLLYSSYRLYSMMSEYNRYVIGYTFMITIYTLGIMIVIRCFTKQYDVLVIIVICMYIVLAAAIEIVSGRQIRDIENDILNNQKEFYAEQMTVVEEADRRTRAIRHDMKNHINVIESLLKNGRTRELQEYIETMRADVYELSNKINTGNFEIDAVINNKISIMGKLGIRLEDNIVIPENMEFESYDMVIIIGNLLDNAVDNCNNKRTISNEYGGHSNGIDNSDCIKKENFNDNSISLTMRYNKGMLKLVVANNCNSISEADTYEYHNRRILSSITTAKKDKKNHGYGLKNVYRIVRKYNGSMMVKREKDRFTAEVVIIEDFAARNTP